MCFITTLCSVLVRQAYKALGRPFRNILFSFTVSMSEAPFKLSELPLGFGNGELIPLDPSFPRVNVLHFFFSLLPHYLLNKIFPVCDGRLLGSK